MREPHRIVADRDICGGKPTIRGTRIMVWNILGMFAGGVMMDDILKSYPSITREDIVASLEYVMDLLDEETVIFRDWSELDTSANQGSPR
jgi:uncharacterized protein (DUF433 family)